jgi:hypothetical protein
MIISSWDMRSDRWHDDYDHITADGTYTFDVAVSGNAERSFSAFIQYVAGTRKIATPIIYNNGYDMFCLLIVVNEDGQIGHNLYNVGNPNLSVYDSVTIKWQRVS